MQQPHVVETNRAVESSQRGVERIMPGWTSEALSFIHEFATAHSSFTTEDIREAAEGKVPTPPDGRAWGPAIRKAVRLGYIEPVGYRAARDPKVHSNIVRVWRSKVRP